MTSIKVNKKFKLVDGLKEYLYKTNVELESLDTIKNNNEIFNSNLELYNILQQKTNNKNFLYPIYDDDEFQIKIASKKEFNDFSYKVEVKNVQEEGETLCAKNFELAPHQQFIRNFLSSNTPYNSLLLYHGLGTGKTCSAIGVSEEMRTYLKQMNISERIIIVASPNVQENFKMQLFDERKLYFKNNSWNIDNCAGKNFLKEINSISNKKITKEQIIRNVKNAINSSYLFMGYIEFANYIIKNTNKNIEDVSDIKEREKIISNKIQNLFNNRLVIIDEIQNVRVDSNENKLVAQELLKVVKHVNNMKLLLLSATPMYNSYREIVWLLNLMNMNDKKVTISVNDVFDKTGNFLKDEKTGEEIGIKLLKRKANGYISYVRGENPYSFPYRIWPDQFDNTKSIKKLDFEYPKIQLNNKIIKDPIKHLSIYTNKIGNYQEKAYNYIIKNIQELKKDSKSKIDFENLDTFGYNVLQKLIECLIIAYPNDKIEDMTGGASNDDEEAIKEQKESVKLEQLPEVEQPSEEEKESIEEPVISEVEQPSEEEKESIEEPIISEVEQPTEEEKESIEEPLESEKLAEQEVERYSNIELDTKELVGKNGLNNIMKYKVSSSPPSRYDFEFTNKKYNNIFAYDKIEKYSSKIKSILDNILNSEGIILIYSQYIDGGLIPLALALESMGFTRYGETKSLFKIPPNEKLDVNTYLPKSSVDKDKFKSAKYTMITGDKTITPNYITDLKAATNDSNKNGEDIKVILISQAGSEGIDFKCIRQVHILDPWYNMNRIEQIIGRGVRTCSHSSLTFIKRNVSIYLHGLLLNNNQESVDLYLYRIAESKAIKIGEVSRILKQISIDCILNQEQQKFDENTMNQTINITLSNNNKIDYKVGDKPFSSICDYMESCTYKCDNDQKLDQIVVDNNNYNEKFLITNNEYINNIVKNLFKEKFFYYKKDLLSKININKKYSNEQIYSALSDLINNKNEFLTDKFNNIGHLVNVDNIYFFQPQEIKYKREDLYFKSKPLVKLNKSINYKLLDNFKEFDNKKKIKIIDDDKVEIKETEKIKETELVSKIIFNKTDTEKIVKQLQENYNLLDSKQLLVRGEDNYYKAASIVIDDLQDKIDKNLMIEFLFEHQIEVLDYKNHFNLINYLYYKNINDNVNEFENKIINYYKNNIISNGTIDGIIINDHGLLKLLVYNKKFNTWEEGKSEIKELEDEIKKLTIEKNNYNLILGFIGSFKNTLNVFKTKQMDKKRNKGARCDQSGKSDALLILNNIIGKQEYTIANTKKYNQIFICIIQELYLRYFNYIKKNEKMWFLKPELAIINDIEKIQL